ncbi:sugar transferase [Candidatus Saccharibacteria bacterium]|nr:sugar transferase [Candidatus Saccharibacteria bacterium]
MRRGELRLSNGIDFTTTRRYEKLHTARFLTFGAFKRGFDLVAGATMLVGLSPVFLIVAIAIKIDSPGPVFFKQKRTGKNGKEFKMYKFRSMVADNDVRDKSCEDKYTRVGKKLRQTSIDELPQLINVVKGQMSFIGPRPWIVEYWDNMTEEEQGRAKVRPGITGLAAAKGRNGLSVFEKIGYDLEYVKHYSLFMDVKVIALTVKTVLTREGASSNKGAIHNELEALKLRDYDKPAQRARNKGREK